MMCQPVLCPPISPWQWWLHKGTLWTSLGWALWVPASLCSLGMSRVLYLRGRKKREDIRNHFTITKKTLFVSKFEGNNILLCPHLQGRRTELPRGLELSLATCLSLLALLPVPSRSRTKIKEQIEWGSLQEETSLAPGLNPHRKVQPRLWRNWGRQSVFDLVEGGRGKGTHYPDVKNNTRKKKKKSKKDTLETIYRYNWLGRLFLSLLHFVHWTSLYSCQGIFGI